ncbi:membrane protein [Streptococcus pyogenes]|nr:hypothetical protein STAB901_05065 [Streptococcus pyogenes STAB901]ANC23973.1 hypothetical protein MGAS11027_0978 [Streptococcus pyogenes]EQL80490.1 hypothetical protein HMPREF1226_0149 [Streptococcus pyogenes UTMEM-1]EQL83105.1 hypothetical protein HMPREF1230_0509 [Streptococcus pyogenes GA19681]ERL14759.1 hypothetical protein HMPREF1231_2206 [Streptococcus pyogenes GA06023]ERL19527.1 hypothetical protein HMPREF1227_1887 [Streptococcus pyogenes GA41046]ESA46000.1 hypothetical protein HMPR
MTYSFIDILQVTLVSLFLVLTCLTGIMGLMMLSGKLLSQEKKLSLNKLPAFLKSKKLTS